MALIGTTWFGEEHLLFSQLGNRLVTCLEEDVQQFVLWCEGHFTHKCVWWIAVCVGHVYWQNFPWLLLYHLPVPWPRWLFGHYMWVAPDCWESVVACGMHFEGIIATRATFTIMLKEAWLHIQVIVVPSNRPHLTCMVLLDAALTCLVWATLVSLSKGYDTTMMIVCVVTIQSPYWAEIHDCCQRMHWSCKAPGHPREVKGTHTYPMAWVT
jgi:hypothetical protein